jgi:hypothetical protein
MTIAADSIDAARRGETVRLEAGEVSLVLLRADVFERLRDSLDPRDGYAFVNEVLREDDEHDPLLATYQ